MESVIELEEIKAQLEGFSLSASDEVLRKMKELAFVYRFDAETIVDNWVAYSTSKRDMNPTVKMLDQLEKDVLMKPKTTKNRKSKSSIAAPVYNSSTIDNINDTSDIIMISDQVNKTNVTAKTPGMFSPNSVSPRCFTPSMKYATRKGSGDVVCSFGKFKDIVWKHSEEYSCSVMAYDEKTVVKEEYNYMCEKLRDLASILNDMIQDSAQIFKEKYDIEDWGHIQIPSVESIPVVGRICADGTGRLNSSTMFLEGSQEISSGQTIPLDVSQLEQFSFFPGQIIAGQGMNSTGKKMLLNKTYEGIFPPVCNEAPDLDNCYDSLSVVLAAGPFATSDTLSYEPLQDLMKYVKTHMPQVLILIGPFVDVKNQMIENDELTETYDEIFQGLVSQILVHIESLSTKVVLIPSTRDAHHHSIYPTPPFRLKQSSKRLFLASDPCILKIDGVLFGVTATDVLFHLGKEEISYPQLSDRLGRLCGHILTQKNFYPLYPPNEEINIDYLHFENSAGIPVMPHIMVLPSDLRHFIKDINGCCCINPERLTKRVTGGTFSRIKVKCVDKANYSGSILDFVQVEILKI